MKIRFYILAIFNALYTYILFYILRKIRYKYYIVYPDNNFIKFNKMDINFNSIIIDNQRYNIYEIVDEIINPTLIKRWIYLIKTK